MTRNLKISLGLAFAALVALTIAAATGGGGGSNGADSSRADIDVALTPAERATRLARPDSQRLSVAEDGKATLVEFLDFECEACGAAYPAMEELRSRYGSRITFVVRNMPLHFNSEAAARAAEAAAAQGKFEEMYDRLFQTQSDWGEQQTSQEEIFFGFAQDLGLDMQQFRAVYEDPATIERIRRDKRDGEALGVTGTPTFFFNGDQLEVTSLAQLYRLIDNALDA